MIRKILIANRGEIACRIIRTCRQMGVASVAVYSDIDAGAMHVQMADQAVALGGATPAESYLRGDAILAAALSTGADAIHPGYGFLSENPDFADAVAQAGLIFIGPSADAIRAMGLKDAAKALMQTASVPVVPGYHGADQSDATLSAAATEIGYPVLIKAVAGGGGKGMRLVETADDFADALASARAEAASSFGNPDVLVEKYITHPRHIEVQVFGDSHGNVVHLYERDCSLQRRHQKVIEEAPAPGMTDAVRDAMGKAAVEAARAVNYTGAGTVEFIADGSDGLRADGFWFMEMNTRLQVEHPVTEAVLGLDLVDWQIRVASGQPLPLSQDEIQLNGHAFEARLYAEDPATGFLPATGPLDHLQVPGHLRCDSGVRSGDMVSPYYDPMIAKLIAHGPDRATAMARLRAGLAQTQIAGVTTNRGFLVRLLDQKDVASGAVETGLIGAHLDDLTDLPEPNETQRAIAALTFALPEGGAPDAGQTLWAPLEQQITLQDGPVRYRILGPAKAQVLQDTTWSDYIYTTRWAPTEAHAPEIPVLHGDTVTLFGDTTTTRFHRPDPLATQSQDAVTDQIIAPMPGLVRAVFVTPGQSVALGDKLAVLEAMKMEHVLTAGRDARIEQVFVRENDQVEAGAPLIQLEEAPE